jgi:hypothetical protein
MTMYAPKFQTLLDSCDDLEGRLPQLRVRYPNDHDFLMVFAREAERLEGIAHRQDDGHDDCSIWLHVHGRLEAMLESSGIQPDRLGKVGSA